MFRDHKRRTLAATLFLGILATLGMLLYSLLNAGSPVYSHSLFQSHLPSPPEDPNTVYASEGGKVHCGAVQSTVWLRIPADFTSDWGSHIYCDPVGDLPQNPSTWNQKGYLVGFWASLLKPLTLVFEIDTTRVEDFGDGSFVGRYYAPDRGWISLPTQADTANLRVKVEISDGLSPSDYPGYKDRYLVALFQAVPPTSTPTSTPAQTPTPDPTRTSETSPTFTQTVTDTPTDTPTETPTPTNTPEPTLTPTTVQATESTRETLPSEKDSNDQLQDDNENRSLEVIVIGGVLGILIIGIVIVLIKRR
jgi:hypothetical protein